MSLWGEKHNLDPNYEGQVWLTITSSSPLRCLYAKLMVEIAVFLKHLHYISEERGGERSAQITNSLFTY